MTPLVLFAFLLGGGFNPSSFKSTSFATFEAEENAEVPKGMVGIDTTLTGVLIGGRPSGKTRALPAAHRAFMSKVGTAVGNPTLGGRASAYTQEVEIVDAKRGYWVATTPEDAESLRAKTAGDVELAMRNLGSIVSGTAREHVYLVINFRERTGGASPQRGQRLEGRSADVSIALPGFSQELGPGSLGGTYERLAQLTRMEKGKSALHLSVLVDTLPAGFNLAKLKAHVLSSYAKRIGTAEPRVTMVDKPAGFLVEWEERIATVRQWNVYFETIAGPRWLELHFSVMQAQKDDLAWYRELIGSIVASVVVTPKTAR